MVAEITKQCFGEEILIDGKELNREEIQQWMKENITKLQDYSIKELFKQMIWHLCEDSEAVYHDRCDQCGDYNSKTILKL